MMAAAAISEILGGCQSLGEKAGGATGSTSLLCKPGGTGPALPPLLPRLVTSLLPFLYELLSFMYKYILYMPSYKKFQLPAYCNWFPSSSTETAHPKFMVDIIINKPSGYFSIFIFLDLCGIFDIAHSPCIIETLALRRFLA